MATEIVMPRLSDTMDSGTIAKWLKGEGDSIKKGEIIAEIETDKANMELEAFSSGVLAQILVNEGQSARLGQPIAMVAATEAEAQQMKGGGAEGSTELSPESRAQKGSDSSSSNGNVSATRTQDEPVNVPASEAPEQSPASAGDSGGDGAAASAPAGARIKASPLARRMAEENGLNLTEIPGTGPGGRITKEDVQAHLRLTDSAPRPAPIPMTATSHESSREQQPVPAGGRAPRPVDLNRMQQTIARRMVESRYSAPEFVLVSEVDMTDARALLRGIASTEGAPKVGPNDLIIKSVASALSRHAEVNAGWENNTAVQYGRINIGFAVAVPKGLIVPVVHDANTKTLGQIGSETKELVHKTRNGKLAPFEYENGTFSISNLGMYGIDQFTPIINTPEACILGVGAIVQKPVVVDGQVVIRDRMRLTLSCDHRVVYGAEGAEFLRTLKRLLESPVLTLL
jgi:pyruvate dehydrogenase E2 component (dihydrolipoamide acetyltransferase)